MAHKEWHIDRLKMKPGLVWQMAVNSLKVRISRTTLTLLTIATSSAFLIYLLTLPRSDDLADQQTWYLMLGLSVLVSAAGVLNTMLMSVSQRYREIGTMKCLGALDKFVLFTVMVESAILGFVGAVIGVLVGLTISILLGLLEYGFSLFQYLQFDWILLKILAAFALGIFLTTFGSSIPAVIASRMPPMDAMRGEK
ncbi:MAG: FtsX-like permease family protein [Opitutales bacterium]|nr:FtsX-like permease family protein [Opitutales bacterium]MCH8540863.1 FtsX-like permease family protein [Opitutales bacterium]